MKAIPYYTTEDESQWCGHIWKQRREKGGPWGFMWEVIPPYAGDDDAVARGWSHRQDLAEMRMNEALEKAMR